MENNTEESLELRNRRSLRINGVNNVINYCEYSVALELSDVRLTVEGENLSITKLNLDNGEVAIEGMVCSMVYSDGEIRKSGILSRLFG